MNRGVFQSSSVQQIMGGTNPSWWSSINNMRPPQGDQASSLLYPSPSYSSSSSSSSLFHHLYSQPSSLLPPMFHSQDNQELPESWSQLLLGGLVGEDESCAVNLNPFQGRKMENNWEDQVVYSSASSHMGDVKQESSESGYVYGHGSCDEIHGSGRSCVTTSFSSSILDFSSNTNKPEKRQAHQLQDHSSECNSTVNGAAFKKARIQASSPSSAQSTFKVRKEKLGDRITALHQLVSPFGKTDTASVLLEAIGYIRFLQGQIEALSSPYLSTASVTRRQLGVQGETNSVFPEDPGQLLNDNNLKRRAAKDDQTTVNDEAKKDLRSRGLCLVPVSCTLHVGSENGADYWAPTFGGGFM